MGTQDTMSIEIEDCPSYEGNDCIVCIPQFRADRTVIRPEGLMQITISRGGPNGAAVLRLCPQHAVEFGVDLASHGMARGAKGAGATT